jgi:acyl-CoA thioester hydrolase
MPRHRVPVHLRWADQDAYGHVNNSVFGQLLEEARVSLLSGWDLGLLRTGIVVAHLEIEYRQPLNHRAEPVDVELWVTRIGTADFDLHYEIRDEAAVYARAATTMVVYSLAESRPRRMIEAEREVLAACTDEPVAFRRRRAG